MKAVYVCRGGNNEELRYSLRSVDENLRCVDEALVYGGKPPWCVCRFTPLSRGGSKYARTYNNLRAACEDESVGDTFVLMNDDFYIMEPMDEVPVLHRGKMLDIVKWYEKEYPSAVYTANTRRTYEYLKALGIKNPKSYELHVPMVFDREKLLEVLYMIEGDMSLQYRTIYGNLCSIGGDKIDDVKVYTEDDDIPEGVFLSSWDSAPNKVLGVLRKKFPKPSRWESTNAFGRSVVLSRDIVFEGKTYPAHTRIAHDLAVRMSRAGVLKAKIR